MRHVRYNVCWFCFLFFIQLLSSFFFIQSQHTVTVSHCIGIFDCIRNCIEIGSRFFFVFLLCQIDYLILCDGSGSGDTRAIFIQIDWSIAGHNQIIYWVILFHLHTLCKYYRRRTTKNERKQQQQHMWFLGSRELCFMDFSAALNVILCLVLCVAELSRTLNNNNNNKRCRPFLLKAETVRCGGWNMCRWVINGMNKTFRRVHLFLPTRDRMENACDWVD